ncbi:hypothetical protein J2T17_004377 [Paenibacillus mucilaginosus]|uniref:IMCp domain-containing protein n=1 Tax=Paenibacillus mucilaginosus TaxID=61624 RepID=UPI003D224E44
MEDTPLKNVIIVNPDIAFADAMKKRLEMKGLKIVETIVVLEHLIQTIEENLVRGHSIYGIIISSNIAKNKQGKRLEFLADVILTIRERYAEIRFIFMSDEVDQHPLHAELVSLGIYNIITRNNSKQLDIAEFVTLLEKQRSFAEVKHLRDADPDIQWRRGPSAGPQSLNVKVNIEKAAPAPAAEPAPTAEPTPSKPIVIEKERIVERERIVEKLVEKPVVQIVEKIKEVRIPSKTIVIGSAYPGAGSTFITLALSRILNYIGINNAVVEHPAVEPALYSMLFGDSKLPGDYRFLSDHIVHQGIMHNRTEWTDGNSSWYPLPPKGLHNAMNWTSDMTLKMLYHIKEPIVLLDVSHKWNDPAVKEICLSADELLMVVDPMLPIRFYRSETKENTDVFFGARNIGKSGTIIANRDIKVAKRNEWLGSLPMPPVSIVPAIDYARVVDSLWSNLHLADDDAIREELIYGLYGTLKKIVPKDYPMHQLKKQAKSGGLFQKLFGRSG